MRYPLRCVFILMLWFAATVPAHADPLRLGVTLSLTGKYAELGAMDQRAYKLWEEDVNRRGGLLGRPVEITIVDDKSDAQLAKTLYQDFILKNKVDLLLGPYSSEITDVVADVAEQYRYPLLASGGSADSIWQKGRSYVFGVYITSNKYTVGFLELLVKAGIEKIAIVAADDVFSKSIEEGTKNWARRYELNIVYSGTFKKGSAEIGSRIDSARKAGAQALIVAGHFDDAINGRRVLKKSGWTPKAYYATVGPAIQQYADTLKGDADYTYTSSQWEPTLPFPGAREFAKTFSDRYHVTPSYQAASAYAAGQILEAAVRKARNLDRQKLRDALATLDTMTLLGRYGVDSDGRQIRHFTTTIQWQKGKKEIVAPQELQTVKPIWQ
ncbi:MAG TPA: amino acid ABC transporter substrate-binding protein [Oxalicibacterium sp.]|nr:amino acid ABC transporter substrate-binding protein [Oxalicibacterium sp.]